MEAPRFQFAVKLLPSLTDFAFLMPIVFLFGRMEGVKTLLSDGDTGWHIRTGEWIVAHHGVPVRDIFSFSRAGDPWYAWEWLSEVLFAWLNSCGGLAAVALFSILLIAITFMLLFRRGRTCSRSCSWCCFTARSNGFGTGAPVWPACRTWHFCRPPRFCGPTCTADSSSAF
jgi:hypothetical protein